MSRPVMLANSEPSELYRTTLQNAGAVDLQKRTHTDRKSYRLG